MPPVRVIITDVDGTLMPFATSTKLSARNAAALASAVQLGCRVSVATGRIPGPWYEALCSQMPELFGPGVFCNGALVLDGRQVLHSTPLSLEAVAAVVKATAGGCVGGRKIGVLAVTEVETGYEYSELAPDGPSWVTQMIERAGERVRPEPSHAHLLDQEVYKFVMFTADSEDWAAMDKVIPILGTVLRPADATILDCGGGHCEILPPMVNKGRQKRDERNYRRSSMGYGGSKQPADRRVLSSMDFAGDRLVSYTYLI